MRPIQLFLLLVLASTSACVHGRYGDPVSQEMRDGIDDEVMAASPMFAWLPWPHGGEFPSTLDSLYCITELNEFLSRLHDDRFVFLIGFDGSMFYVYGIGTNEAGEVDREKRLLIWPTKDTVLGDAELLSRLPKKECLRASGSFYVSEF